MPLVGQNSTTRRAVFAAPVAIAAAGIIATVSSPTIAADLHARKWLSEFVAAGGLLIGPVASGGEERVGLSWRHQREGVSRAAEMYRAIEDDDAFLERVEATALELRRRGAI